MSGGQILVVEDERKIAELLIDYLQLAEFRTHHISRGDAVLPWLQENRVLLVLLDVMLPGQDGLSVCREIRETSDVPIIFISARVDEVDRLLGLELGADDYICKPFSGREVVARAKAVIRRTAMTADDQQEKYRGLCIDVDQFEASIDGKAIDLTPVEFRILALLGLNPGRIYSRTALVEQMYLDGRVVSDRTVDSHVKNLRKKLTAATADEEWIRSIYGVGYRLD